MILTLDFPAPDYSVMRVKSDAGKVRDIVKQKYFPWRILHHAIMRVIEEDVYRNLIYDTSACIKGRDYIWSKENETFSSPIPGIQMVRKD